MRLFFGLRFDPETLSSIDHWRRTSLPPFLKPVAQENLHMTLVFLGDASLAVCDRLAADMSSVTAPKFTLHLDTLGYWPKQEISYLGPQTIPSPLDSLVTQLRKLGSRQGLKVDRRRYQPHVTLARRCELPPPPPLLPPDMTINVEDFSLIESTRVAGGVRYESVCDYPLECDG